jgi:hypothetical protein
MAKLIEYQPKRNNMKLICLFLLFSTQSVFCQNFRILVEEGTVYETKTLKVNGQKIVKNIPLFCGDKIPKGAIITIGKDGYLFIRHNNGHAYDFLTPQTLRIDSLEEIASQKTSIANKYVLFYMVKLMQANTIDFSKNHNRYFIDEASPVYRCPENPATAYLQNEPENGSHLMLFYNHLFLRLYPKYSFEALEKPFAYLVKVKNFYDQTLYEETIHMLNPQENLSTTLNIDLSTLKSRKKDVNSFIVDISISTYNGMCKSYVFEVISDEKRAAFLLDAPPLNPSADDLDGHLQAFVFFEDKGFITDAFDYLERIIKMRPNVKTFRILYEDFKIQHRMRSFPTSGRQNSQFDFMVFKKDDFVIIYDRRFMQSYNYLSIQPTQPTDLKAKYNKKN